MSFLKCGHQNVTVSPVRPQNTICKGDAIFFLIVCVYTQGLTVGPISSSVTSSMSWGFKLSGNVLAECDLLSLFLELQPCKRRKPAHGSGRQLGLDVTQVQLPACQRLLEKTQLIPLGSEH